MLLLINLWCLFTRVSPSSPLHFFILPVISGSLPLHFHTTNHFCYPFLHCIYLPFLPHFRLISSLYQPFLPHSFLHTILSHFHHFITQPFLPHFFTIPAVSASLPPHFLPRPCAISTLWASYASLPWLTSSLITLYTATCYIHNASWVGGPRNK